MRFYLIFTIILFKILNVSAQTSLLSNGEWFKIGVVESGIYKIDKKFLQENKVLINNFDPKNIQVYGSGYNGALPQLNSLSNKINPEEVQLGFSGNSDNNFDDDEFIFFYLQSPDKIYFDGIINKVKTEKNIYTDTAYYFIKLNGELPRKINSQVSISNFEEEVNDVFFNYRYENDIYSIIQSGRNWYGEIFSPGNSLSIPLNEFFIDNSKVSLEFGLVSRSTVPSYFSVSIDNSELSLFDMNTIKEGIYGNKIISQIEMTEFNYTSNGGYINLKYSGNNSAISYLDYLDISGTVSLNYLGDNLSFFSIPENRILFKKYNISTNKDYGFDKEGNSNLKFWDISNPYNIIELETIKENEKYFVIKDDSAFSRNIIFDIENLIYPFFSKRVQNSNILNSNNPDLLIITHSDFFQDAQRIKLLREEEGLSVFITNINDIYNQFSSGNQDVSAIRNYIKYIYNSSGEKLKYVLLFGDCSYDYKNRIPNNTNYIPIYQSYNSTNNIFSYSSDDYYGFLDEEEGKWFESLSGDHELDVGIGRIPSKSLDEATAYVDKLYIYSSKGKIKGDWKKNIYLVADDGDNNVHQNDAENHFVLLDNESKNYNIKKIYLDNYEQKLTGGVKTSEKAKNKLNKAIENGSFIINYIGHGNEFLWTEEKILDENSIYNWENRNKLPLFLTATCEFGKFDDPLITSGGEMLLYKKNGGAIALLTTTRPVFSQTNYRLNNQFYKNVFKKVDNKFYRLGDIFKETKNRSLSGSINRNFALLGDPSLQLSYPEYNIKVNEIDTLMAGGKFQLSGEVVDVNNIKIENFNGEVFTEIYDKVSSKLTLGDESTPFPFREWDDLIFKGISSIINGSFKVEFVVPSSIEYDYGKGKISLFATDTTNFLEAIDNEQVVIGGTSSEFNDDDIGPEINIFIDDYNFISGNRVSKSPLLIVDLFDKNGLNITESKTFHKMTAILNDTSEIYLNDYFSPLKDDYTSGSIRYPLNMLNPGKYRVEIKVSDNYNNMSTNSVVFIVGSENKLKISNLVNYPNPFSESTNFKFDNGELDQPLEIKLQIFDLRGNMVFSLDKTYEFSPAVIDDLNWNGRDLNNYPLSQGIYIYKLHVSNLLNGATIILHNKLFKKI